MGQLSCNNSKISIKKKNIFDFIKYDARLFNGENVASKCLIPGFQILGHQAHFLDISSNFTLKFQEDEFCIFNLSLYDSYVNRNFIDFIGEFLGLELFSDNNTYGYLMPFNNHRLALSFSYYHNKDLSIQLFILHKTFWGEEKTKELDSILFGLIWAVEFSHEEFMELYKKV